MKNIVGFLLLPFVFVLLVVGFFVFQIKVIIDSVCDNWKHRKRNVKLTYNNGVYKVKGLTKEEMEKYFRLERGNDIVINVEENIEIKGNK